VELYIHSPNTPPWRGAQLKHRDNFTFTFTLMFIYSTFKNIHLFHPIYRVPKSCGK